MVWYSQSESRCLPNCRIKIWIMKMFFDNSDHKWCYSRILIDLLELPIVNVIAVSVFLKDLRVQRKSYIMGISLFTSTSSNDTVCSLGWLFSNLGICTPAQTKPLDCGSQNPTVDRGYNLYMRNEFLVPLTSYYVWTGL